MDNNLLSTVCSQVYQKFPDLSGSHPRQQNQPNDQILLIFHGQSSTGDGRKIQRTVRVLVTRQGKIIKLTTSR